MANTRTCLRDQKGIERTYSLTVLLESVIFDVGNLGRLTMPTVNSHGVNIGYFMERTWVPRPSV